MANREKLLRLCIYDYLYRNDMTEIARSLGNKTGLRTHDIGSIPANFLSIWWITYCDCMSNPTFVQYSVTEQHPTALTNPTSVQNSVTEQRPTVFPGCSGSSSTDITWSSCLKSVDNSINPNQFSGYQKLQKCIYGYLLENDMTGIAQSFANKTGLRNDASISVNFLSAWWNVYCDRLIIPTPTLNSVAERPMERKNTYVGFGRPNTLISGTYGMSSSNGNGVRNNKKPMSGLPSTDQSISSRGPKPLNISDGVCSSSMSMNKSSSIGETNADIDNSAKNGSSQVELYNTTSTRDQLICCDFSSEGDILACIGQNKKLVLWNTNNNTFVTTRKKEYNPHITDIRFARGSSYLAAYSLDKNIELWNSNKSILHGPSRPLFKIYLKEPVTSMDFNPRKTEQLCCSDSSQIRMWNINSRTSEFFFEEDTRQVRFCPGDGNKLASLTRNKIRLFDMEKKSLIFSLNLGHKKEVHTICWDSSGEYIASVSEDQARVWSTNAAAKPNHEIESTGKLFQSCTFHPRYSQAFIIGSNQSLEVWNPSMSNSTESIIAHSGSVSALCSSSKAGLIASTSNDNILNLWK